MIWWCLEHKCSFQSDYLLNCDAREGNVRAEDYVSTGPLSRECRRVEALLIVKEVGDWPVWAISKMYEVSDLKDFPSALLDTLASVGGATDG